MKLILSIIITTSIQVCPTFARTWTSSNGVTTFEGEYVSSTGRSLVLITQGKKTSIRISRLSEADRAWIAKERQRDATHKRKKSYSSLRAQPVGKKLINQTFRVRNNQFVTENIRKVPQYYHSTVSGILQ